MKIYLVFLTILVGSLIWPKDQETGAEFLEPMFYQTVDTEGHPTDPSSIINLHASPGEGLTISIEFIPVGYKKSQRFYSEDILKDTDSGLPHAHVIQWVLVKTAGITVPKDNFLDIEQSCEFIYPDDGDGYEDGTQVLSFYNGPELVSGVDIAHMQATLQISPYAIPGKYMVRTRIGRGLDTAKRLDPEGYVMSDHYLPFMITVD